MESYTCCKLLFFSAQVVVGSGNFRELLYISRPNLGMSTSQLVSLELVSFVLVHPRSCLAGEMFAFDSQDLQHGSMHTDF